MGRKKIDPKTRFAVEASAMMSSRGATMSDISASTGISPSYAYNVLRGERNASPEFVNNIATALSVSEQERNRLNIAAAVDAGFNLGLPEDW